MKKILIVEDDIWINRLMQNFLESHNFKTMSVTNGNDAIDITHLESPDLIIMDMHLPYISGWEAADALKSHPQTQNIPIIAISVATTQDERKKGLDIGCDAYFIKPMILKDLLTTITQFLPQA
ncbi:MAG: response regulator [Chloroflexi bacterium]|nr:response regulator [Chloroflexota bacterium]